MRKNNFKASSKLNSLRSLKRRKLSDVNHIIILIAAIIVPLLGGCDPSGSVGGGLGGSETDIQYDTTTISQIHVDTLVAYTGNLNFFSAGQFKDPLFGDITATGFIKPPLASNGDSLVFDESTEVFLKLALNNDTVYGDTLAGQKFNIYEIQQLWRGNQWKINQEVPLAPSPLTSFTVQHKDTLQIPLPSTWAEKYADYFKLDRSNRDSIYFREFWGLSIVPDNYGKIVTVDPFTSSLLITNLKVVKPDSVIVENPRLDSLSTSLGSGEWAYNLQRRNVVSPPDSDSTDKLISTYERVFRFEYDFDFEDIKRRNIAKVEILFYVDKQLLDQSINQAGSSVVRPEAKVLNLHFMKDDELPQALSQYNMKNQLEYAKAEYSPEDSAYHFDVTGQFKTDFFEAGKDERNFYITIGKNDGVLRSGLLFNSLAAGKQPQVIVTFVEIDN